MSTKTHLLRLLCILLTLSFSTGTFAANSTLKGGQLQTKGQKGVKVGGAMVVKTQSIKPKSEFFKGVKNATKKGGLKAGGNPGGAGNLGGAGHPGGAAPAQ